MGRSVKVAFQNKDKYIALGLNIAYYRKREGMTQEQLPPSTAPVQLEVGGAAPVGKPEAANIPPAFNPPAPAPVP